MNKKKVLALLAAATMLFSTVPVSAGQVVTDSSTQTTVSGSGTVNGVDMDAIYQVTLPTGNALDFTVDPYNLINLGTGTAALDTSTGAGAIISASGSGAIMKNESSVPVQITATFAVTDANNKVTLVTDDADDVITSTDTAMFLATIPSKVKAATVASYEAASTVVPVTNGSSVSFKLNKATYVITSDNNNGFKMVLASDAANYDATVFKLGGKVNKVGDWDAYSAGDFSVSAVFKFTGLETTASDSAVQVRTDAYGLVSGQSVVEDYEPAAGKEEVNTICYADDNGVWIYKDANYAGFDSLDGATVKLNGYDCAYTPTVVDGSNYVYVTFDQVTAMGEDVGTTWNFEVTIGNTIYKATKTW